MDSLLRNNLFQRFIVALAGIPLLLWINATGGLYFLAMLLLLSLVATFEFHRMAEHRAHPSSLMLMLFLTAFLQVNFYYTFLEYWEALLAALMLLFVAELYRKQGSQLLDLGAALVGLLYVNLTFGALLRLRMIDAGTHHAGGGGGAPGRGAALVLLMFVCVWAADIFAFFGGRALGGRFIKQKLFPRLSPNKTWEGYFSGIAGSISAAFFCSEFVPASPSDNILLFGILIGVTCPAGDLMESMFKRDAGVKDSSGLIPGHGGVLDRFDTIMFIAPLLYFLAKYA